ncbi:MAG: hypothetical protein ACP5O1_01100 [Phycisphaerae bacterium]
MPRLVEATNNISPSGARFSPDGRGRINILAAPRRAVQFVGSQDFRVLKTELDARVERYKTYIVLAALIENVNVRGRVIEYLIAGESEQLVHDIVVALEAGNVGMPAFRTHNTLGDYSRSFNGFDTKTDIKTKVMVLSSNPKAYNLDKMLEYLSHERSVFLIYLIGVKPGTIVNTVLVSIFQRQLLKATILLKHWFGRNSLGVTQFEGRALNQLITNPEQDIDESKAVAFLEKVIGL